MLCADTQETVGQYLKPEQPKITIVGDRSNSPRAVFAGAAEDGDLADALVDKLWPAMEPKGTKGLDAMIKAAENELTAQYKRLVPLYPSGIVPGSAFLVGAWAAPNEFDLMKINGLYSNNASYWTRLDAVLFLQPISPAACFILSHGSGRQYRSEFI